MEDLARGHSEEIERVREEERERGEKERERLSEEWHRAAEQREVKFREEVKMVRDEGEREKWEVVKTEQNRHQQEMGKKPVLVIPYKAPCNPHTHSQPHCRVFW